ncbi:MAG: NAD-binding protein [Candidatus Micrarchaeota archaeon]|nr:NAD-binding protein [Candidatus Micrarchaeota archaeon]
MAQAKGMNGHVIICGYGIVGQKIADVLSEHSIPFVIIDNTTLRVEKLRELGMGVIDGDATHSKTLKAAGVETAKAIAIAIDDDAKSLFIVLTARDLNKKIFITARANDEFVREKLIEAGADYVAMPQKAASKEIVKELLKSET